MVSCTPQAEKDRAKMQSLLKYKKELSKQYSELVVEKNIVVDIARFQYMKYTDSINHLKNSNLNLYIHLMEQSNKLRYIADSINICVKNDIDIFRLKSKIDSVKNEIEELNLIK